MGSLRTLLPFSWPPLRDSLPITGRATYRLYKTIIVRGERRDWKEKKREETEHQRGRRQERSTAYRSLRAYRPVPIYRPGNTCLDVDVVPAWSNK
ncbi:uncharacterized protein LOC125500007 isoform X2 [Athalia rosae]|uniref:uncharacterized protein LOC125500007 isoform X2 n=1 Tax=Athalia rosae TaxID=37344 RepID=UPI00203446E9|nr:uncharacterized protein LOC125500007 isoform X2 [Athalia rosae]